MLLLLLSRSRGLLAAACCGSVASGVCGVLLIALINRALSLDAAPRSELAGPFVGVAALAMMCRLFANVSFQRLCERAHADLRGLVAERAMLADYRSLELAGAARVQSALAEHAAKLAELFGFMPSILTNSVIVAGCLVYMGTLSGGLLLAAAAAIALGSLSYHFAHLRAIRHLTVAAEEQDRLYGFFHSLTAGAKELRLDRRKRATFRDDALGASIEAARRARTRGMALFVAASSWGNFLVYAFIGFVLFGSAGEDARVVTGYALVFIFLVAPLEALLLNIPRANMALAAARRIEALLADLTATEPRDAERTPAPTCFQRLELLGVTHRYKRDGADDLFTLGPLDIEFRPGELVFLVGGNGGGKTTFVKLLTGLYAPEQGDLRLDGRLVDDGWRDNYRQLFSAIFADFHLFAGLRDAGGAEIDARAGRLLEKLHLAHVVGMRDGAFTTLALSQGQRKRLALVLAYLEDRPFLVFDEWAADQDPVFKRVFYEELLPELCARGKAVLAITHDDRYFHLADRLLRMENGRIVVADDGFVGRPPTKQTGGQFVSLS
jgi:putative ATP-binding cassette transporter